MLNRDPKMALWHSLDKQRRVTCIPVIKTDWLQRTVTPEDHLITFDRHMGSGTFGGRWELPGILVPALQILESTIKRDLSNLTTGPCALQCIGFRFGRDIRDKEFTQFVYFAIFTQIPHVQLLSEHRYSAHRILSWSEVIAGDQTVRPYHSDLLEEVFGYHIELSS